MSSPRRAAYGALAIAGALVLAVGLSARAQEVGANWLKKPTMEDLMGVWPVSAKADGRGGSAIIRCTVNLQGTLRDCQVLKEDPPGRSFGQAGLALSTQFIFKPATKDGKPVESTVNIPIKWPDLDRDTRSRVARSTMLDDPTPIVSNVVWTQAPSVADVLAAYPAKAKAAKVSGHATLDCAFNAKGALHDCDVLREEPRGEGFGAAARRLANRFVGPTVDGAGHPLSGDHVQLPFVFAAETLGGDSPLVGKPQWTGVPKAEDLLAAFPQEAIKAKVLKGRVVMACTVGPEGHLSGCDVRSEDPAGYGLGKATVGLAGTFRLSLWSVEGLPTIGGTVNVPIRYDLSADPPGPKP